MTARLRFCSIVPQPVRCCREGFETGSQRVISRVEFILAPMSFIGAKSEHKIRLNSIFRQSGERF
jgi:hypothetical protein